MNDVKVEVPNYVTLIPNHVYIRDVNVLLGEDSKIFVTQVLRLTRYKTPTYENIREYISWQATNYKSPFLTGKKPVINPRFTGSLDLLLDKVPVDVLETMSKFSEEFSEYVKSILSPKYFNGKLQHSLTLNFGILPIEDIHADPRNAHSPEWINTALEDNNRKDEGFGTKWKMYITLNNGKLPNFQLLNLFLHNHVQDSDLLEVCGMYDRAELKYFVRLLYSALSRNGNLSHIRDTSLIVLDNVASQVALEYFKEKKPYLLPKFALETQQSDNARPTIN